LSSLNTEIPARYLPPSAEKETLSAAINPFALFPAPDHQSVPESHRFTKITLLPLLLKSLSIAMMEWPLFRSSITPKLEEEEKAKPTLTVRPGTDIAVALSTPTGLYTPTLTGVNMSSVYDIQSKLKHLQYLGMFIIE